MDFESVAGDEVNESQFIELPGQYHMKIVEVMPGTGPKGNAVDGSTFVLESVTAGSEEKTHKLTMFAPKLSAKDGGKFGRQQLLAFFIACGLVEPSQVGSRLAIDERNALNMQLLIDLQIDDYSSREGQTFLRLNGTKVYHVDDPRAASWKCRNDGALQGYPHRKPEGYFAPLLKKPVGGVATAKKLDVSDL